jgi:DNA-directed RNA polymerase specialized sigma24 family protein
MWSQKRDQRRATSLHDLLHAEPTTEFLDSVYAEGNQLLESLEDPVLREVAQLRMEGYSNEEIAERIDRSVKTVERKFQLIRKYLQTTLDGIDG